MAQLTELKALLGSVGEMRYVLGCISQLQDGRFFLEDLSDALALDLSATQTASGFYTGAPSRSNRRRKAPDTPLRQTLAMRECSLKTGPSAYGK